MNFEKDEAKNHNPLQTQNRSTNLSHVARYSACHTAEQGVLTAPHGARQSAPYLVARQRKGRAFSSLCQGDQVARGAVAIEWHSAYHTDIYFCYSAAVGQDWACIGSKIKIVVPNKSVIQAWLLSTGQLNVSTSTRSKARYQTTIFVQWSLSNATLCQGVVRCLALHWRALPSQSLKCFMFPLRHFSLRAAHYQPEVSAAYLTTKPAYL